MTLATRYEVHKNGTVQSSRDGTGRTKRASHRPGGSDGSGHLHIWKLGMKSELSNVSFLAIPSGSHLAGEQGLWKMSYLMLRDGTSSAAQPQ